MRIYEGQNLGGKTISILDSIEVLSPADMTAGHICDNISVIIAPDNSEAQIYYGHTPGQSYIMTPIAEYSNGSWTTYDVTIDPGFIVQNLNPEMIVYGLLRVNETDEFYGHNYDKTRDESYKKSEVDTLVNNTKLPVGTVIERFSKLNNAGFPYGTWTYQGTYNKQYTNGAAFNTPTYIYERVS